jgi:hypothetical protein
MLVSLIGNSWLKPGFDFFEFYSFCITKNKIKPAKKAKFTKIVEFGLKSKLRQFFRGWKD